ncbi:vitamin H transporter [Aspergillus vadensis CBS 113365]|uniref:Vitamin H transporter n=1 Tax=Aspergillus vadensis (strain CBS 113365 / IMI 142717 / IBT 24658) TaxID=1448311 RepID=A0A319B951_ASPVC|nr:vitamin H transporter [Aspergillus vadensis CBS 113365]PYH68364.1 vitamin H transporter [Aspergillus vadensis CBS 113365]
MASERDREPGPRRGAPSNVQTGKWLVKSGPATELLSPEEDRRILRKIDICLLPLMSISYMLQFLDKQALSFTSILDLPGDLHLSGDEFAWASGIYYFGYMVAACPAAMLMVRWHVGKTIAISICIWGVILTVTAACDSAAGLLVERFFLGAAESAIAPGLSVIVAMWYKRSEQPLRQAAWFIGNSFAGIAGGLIAYGLGHIQSMAPWKVVFLLFGSLTVAWSLVFIFLMPDTPMQAWFMNDEDRLKAVTRVRMNMTGIKSSEFKWRQCTEALLDAKTWLFCAITFLGQVPNGALTTVSCQLPSFVLLSNPKFGTIVVNGLGFSTFNSLLLQASCYLAMLIAVLISTGGSSYFTNTRTYWMVWNLCLATIGTALIRELPAHLMWGRFAGKLLMTAAAANFPLTMSLSSGNVAGFTKKMTVNTAILISFCVGNIVGPQLFFESQAPTYTTGFLAIMICYVVGTILCGVARFYLVWENQRRDGVNPPLHGNEEVDGDIAGMLDKTDKETPQFRYVY